MDFQHGLSGPADSDKIVKNNSAMRGCLNGQEKNGSLGDIDFLSMVFIGETAVAVTLPTIQQQFSMSNTAIQWVMNGFFLPLSVFVLFGGKLADHFGCKKIFKFGMLAFILASLVCCFAGSGE